MTPEQNRALDRIQDAAAMLANAIKAFGAIEIVALPTPPADARQYLPEGFPGLLSATLVGSRVTCNPPPADTDLDVLVLVSDMFEAQSCLKFAGFDHDGSEISDHHDFVFDSAFRSYSKGEVNVILTDDEEFHSRFLAASSVAKRLNLLQKDDRVALFQAVLYGNACEAL